MPESNQHTPNDYRYSFPQAPRKWGHDEMIFVQGIRRLFDSLFSGTTIARMLYPVGTVLITTSDEAPYKFGKWTEFEAGITGLHAWERTV